MTGCACEYTSPLEPCVVTNSSHNQTAPPTGPGLIPQTSGRLGRLDTGTGRRPGCEGRPSRPVNVDVWSCGGTRIQLDPGRIGGL